LLDAHVPLFIYRACILDDCFQGDHPGSRVYAGVVLQQISDDAETQEKVAASSIPFLFVLFGCSLLAGQ
jgi:hypothetical protein